MENDKTIISEWEMKVTKATQDAEAAQEAARVAEEKHQEALK